METKNLNRYLTKAFRPLLVIAAFALLLSGCGTAGTNNKIKLDPKNPITIAIWHYYNGAVMNAFEALVKNFNETVGVKEGIIIEGYGIGNVSELEKAVLSSANKEVGSKNMPNIFASYADTAYEAEKMNLLANLDDYFTKEEQSEYLDSYIEEGRIGLNGELKIFPIAKSTEVLMLNDTDWLTFAEANGFTYDDLSTMEDLSRVAEAYYNWTDALTPDIKYNGKSFFGRDSMANLFIIGSKEFDTEIFAVENGTVTFNVNPDVMRKIWDFYYISFISGYFSAYGRFRSDDTKVGDIIAYVGSTSSAAYFPSEVTSDGQVYPIEAKTLPAPHFEGGKNILVQQGAGMVVTKGTPQQEYASVIFLKWFTEISNNIVFSSLSGYTPVKKEAVVYDKYMSSLPDNGLSLGEITKDTLIVSFGEISKSELYSNKAFNGGVSARAVLEYHLQDKANADREEVLKLIESGSTLQQAVEKFNTDDNFNNWLEDLISALDKEG